MATKKWSELSPAQKKKIQEIMDEQEEEDIELGDPEETVVDTKNKDGHRILVIEGPDVEDILARLGLSEDDVEEDDEEEEEETPKRRTRKKVPDVDTESENDEEIQEPKPKPRSRYFGGK